MKKNSIRTGVLLVCLTACLLFSACVISPADEPKETSRTKKTTAAVTTAVPTDVPTGPSSLLTASVTEHSHHFPTTRESTAYTGMFVTGTRDTTEPMTSEPVATSVPTTPATTTTASTEVSATETTVTTPITTSETTVTVTTTNVTTTQPTTPATTTAVTTTKPAESDDAALFPEGFKWLPELSKRMFLRNCTEERFQNFRALYVGAATFQESADLVTPVDTDEADVLMLLLNYQCPELMQIGGSYYYLMEAVNGQRMVVGIEYVYQETEEEYKKNCASIHAIIEEWCAPLQKKSVFEKEDAIYLKLIETCSYDSEFEFSNSAHGVLLSKIARCEGYCKTFELLMWRLGVDCGCLTGDTAGGGEGIMGRHSWNVVNCDGVTAHLDVTYDDMESSGEQYPVPYGFFNVTEDFLWDSRSIDDFYFDLGLPYCDSMAASYLKRFGQIVPAGADPQKALSDAITATISDHKSELRIRFDDVSDFYGITDELGTIIEQNLNRLVSGAWSYRWYTYNDSHVVVILLTY